MRNAADSAYAESDGAANSRLDQSSWIANQVGSQKRRLPDFA
jgi:hypothetical protein